MRWFCLLFALAVLPLGATATVAQKAPKVKKRLLVITESRGYRHGCVTRKGEQLCLVEKVLTEIGQKSEVYDTVCSQDSRKMITAENLRNFDAVFFYTTGSLPISATQKADFITWLKSGKGFVGAHSATDTFYDWPEYGKLIGGYFDGHPWHQKIRVIVEDTRHEATRHLGTSFIITDEIYQFRTPYSRDKLKVLMRLDTDDAEAVRGTLNGKPLAREDKVEVTFRNGKYQVTVNGKAVDPGTLELRAGPRGRRKDRDNALAWTQEYGKGRVFYTALGHSDEVWADPRFQQHILGGLRWAMHLEGTPLPPPRPEGKEK